MTIIGWLFMFLGAVLILIGLVDLWKPIEICFNFKNASHFTTLWWIEYKSMIAILLQEMTFVPVILIVPVGLVFVLVIIPINIIIALYFILTVPRIQRKCGGVAIEAILNGENPEFAVHSYLRSINYKK